MKILVTGGSGFIGSMLVQKLLNNGDKVIVLSRMNGTSTTTIHVDISDYNQLLRIIPNDIDCIVHLASKVYRPNRSFKPYGFTEVNVLGTLNLLKVCKDKRIKRFIYASTYAVYGNSDMLPVSEKCIVHPSNYYSVSKYGGELYCDLYSGTGIECVILRIGYVYGANMHKDFVPARFMRKAIKGKQLEIDGDGLSTYDFIYIDDVVDASIAAIKNGNGTYNIGTGKETNVLSLAKEIISATGSSSIISQKGYNNSRKSTKRFCMDISKACKDLGFLAKYNLRSGIRAYFENILDKN